MVVSLLSGGELCECLFSGAFGFCGLGFIGIDRLEGNSVMHKVVFVYFIIYHF